MDASTTQIAAHHQVTKGMNGKLLTSPPDWRAQNLIGTLETCFEFSRTHILGHRPNE